MTTCGWCGTILRVDLGSGTIERQALDVRFARTFLGGQGFAQKLIFDAYDFAERDPFSPKNVLCIAPGGLTGTMTPGSGRLTVAVALSPSTGGYLDGGAGRHFAAELKYAGYDAIVVTGQAAHPVYLLIADDRIELRDARHLWGRRVRESDRILRDEVDLWQYARLVIGPAGENRVHGAMPSCDIFGAPAGGSTGAVFGAKNLKAIVVKGTRGVRMARPADAVAAFAGVYDANRSDPRFRRFADHGTKWLVELSGVLSCQYNVQPRDFPYETLSAERFTREFATATKSCHACFQHCKHHWVIPDGPFKGEQGSGGDAGTIIPLGPNCGVSDYATILARCFSAVTGVDVTWEDLYRAGDRVRQIEQAMQLLHGFRKADDYFPDHYYGVAVDHGRFEGAVLDREEYTHELENLYRLRGWDNEGLPTGARLHDLGLDDVAARLRAANLLSAA